MPTMLQSEGIVAKRARVSKSGSHCRCCQTCKLLNPACQQTAVSHLCNMHKLSIRGLNMVRHHFMAKSSQALSLVCRPLECKLAKEFAAEAPASRCCAW